MSRNVMLAFAGIVLVSCASSPQQPGTTTLPLRPDLHHFTLDNGMAVYLLQRSQPGVEMRLLVKSGSLQENEHQLGLAHFTEHMAFKGTTHFPGTTGFRQLEQQGVQLGSHINAATSANATVFKLSLPSATPQQTATGLQVLADWAQGISFDKAAFDKERSVIIEEWRLRQGVGFRVNQAIEQLRYHGSRYAERDPIGSLDIVRHASVEEAKNYYHTWYQPQRMTLVVIGDFDRQAVKETISHNFTRPATPDAAKDDPNWRRFAPQSALLINPVFDKEQSARFIQFALQRDVAAPLNTRAGQYDDVLDSLWTTILNQRLATRVDNGLLPSASINPQGAILDDKRIQQLMIVHPSGADYPSALTLLWTEVQRMATAPVTDQELNNARQRLLAKISQQAATEQRYSNEYLASQLTTALEYRLPMMNKKQQLTQTQTLLKNVTPAALQQHVAYFLQVSSPRLALIGPDSDNAGFDRQKITALWQQIRQSRPGVFGLKTPDITLALTPAPRGNIVERQALPLNNTEQWRLNNRIRVIVKTDPSLRDNVQVSLRIPGGRSLENDNNGGMVDWALKLPESSGYGDYSARALNLFAKQHALTLRPYSELLYHGYRGEAPADELDTLLQLLYLKMTQPQFSGPKLEQLKQNFALSLRSIPVERQFLDNINRESHQHGERLVLDANGQWQQFTALQLQQNNQKLLRSTQDMTLVISGAIAQRTVKDAVERWVASLPDSGTRLSWRDTGITPVMRVMSKTYAIASSDKSMVSIQYAAPARWSQKEMLSLQLLDTIASQRLRFSLREQAGGIYALSFSEMLAKLPSSWYSARLNFTTAPARADEMVRLAQQVITTLRQHGVSERDLKEAKNTWQVEKQQAQQSASFWTDAIAQVATDDQDFSRLSHETEMLNALTVADINVVAARYLGQNEQIFKLTPP